MRRFQRILGIVMVLAGIAPTRSTGGYDFEPLGFRSAARFWGIGPGPGYHAPPCGPRPAAFYFHVTRGYAPYVQEPDYRPHLFSEQANWSPVGLPGSEFDDAMIAPGPATSNAPVQPPGAEAPERLPRQPAKPKTRPKSLPKKSRGPLLDELLKEQGEDGERLFEELSPPSPSDLPAPQSSKRPETGDRNSAWW